VGEHIRAVAASSGVHTAALGNLRPGIRSARSASASRYWLGRARKCSAAS
jgi:hypothetical protein